jgi:hypothetical protein
MNSRALRSSASSPQNRRVQVAFGLFLGHCSKIHREDCSGMIKPSRNKHWLTGVAIAASLSAGVARADMVDEATTSCKTKSTVVQIGQLLAAKDMRSYHKLVDAKTKTGDCKPLKARTDIKINIREGDLACVKAKGDTKCAWVLEMALRITSERREPVRQDYFACKSPLYLETGRNVMAANDGEALKRFRSATSQSGECLTLKKGEQVDIERRDDKIFCVRPAGEDQCYWTDSLVLPTITSQETNTTRAKVVVRRGARRAR